MRPSAFTDGYSYQKFSIFRQSRRASMRPSAFTDGYALLVAAATKLGEASMRPSAFTDGYAPARNGGSDMPTPAGFNEAVGFHRRIPITLDDGYRSPFGASMRPSAFTDGYRPYSQPG